MFIEYFIQRKPSIVLHVEVGAHHVERHHRHQSVRIKSIEELTWHLIKEQLVEANDIKVEQEDVLKMAKETTKAQFAQYGMLSVPEDVLDNYAQEMLKKKDTINNLVSRVVEVKLAAALKAQVTLENKNVSMEEFNKMFE